MMQWKFTFFFMLLLLIGSGYVMAQPDAKAVPVNSFSDLRFHFFINYAHGMSKGSYRYNQCKVIRTDRDFQVEAINDRKEVQHWFVPLALQEQPAKAAADSANEHLLFVRKIQQSDGNYVSAKHAIRIGDSVYTVYQHQQMNCYDPRCDQKHNHMPMRTGEIWFSADYGVLVQSDQAKMQYLILKSLSEKAVPHQLIKEILKRQQAPATIQQAYANSQ
jgi:hypothetical protein